MKLRLLFDLEFKSLCEPMTWFHVYLFISIFLIFVWQLHWDAANIDSEFIHCWNTLGSNVTSVFWVKIDSTLAVDESYVR